MGKAKQPISESRKMASRMWGEEHGRELLEARRRSFVAVLRRLHNPCLDDLLLFVNGQMLVLPECGDVHVSELVTAPETSIEWLERCWMLRDDPAADERLASWAYEHVSSAIHGQWIPEPSASLDENGGIVFEWQFADWRIVVDFDIAEENLECTAKRASWRRGPALTMLDVSIAARNTATGEQNEDRVSMRAPDDWSEDLSGTIRNSLRDALRRAGFDPTVAEVLERLGIDPADAVGSAVARGVDRSISVASLIEPGADSRLERARSMSHKEMAGRTAQALRSVGRRREDPTIGRDEGPFTYTPAQLARARRKVREHDILSHSCGCQTCVRFFLDHGRAGGEFRRTASGEGKQVLAPGDFVHCSCCLVRALLEQGYELDQVGKTDENGFYTTCLSLDVSTGRFGPG